MTLWTRQPVCGPRTTVVDRLSRLEAGDVIGDFRVRTWPDEVVLSDPTADDDLIEQYEAFREWADERDVGLSPAFDRRTVSPLVGESRTILTLPMLCLAVYWDGELELVVPCETGDRQWNVVSYLQGVAEGRYGPGDDADSLAPFLER